MATTSTIRVIKFRERQRADRIILTIEIDREPLASMLVEAGLLCPFSDDDPDHISDALARLLHAFVVEKLQ
jgi:hypothetical protein